MDCSTAGCPVLHHLLEFAQTHVHLVNAAISFFSSCLQSFPASGSFPVSQLFVSGGQNIRASKLPHQSFQWTFRVYFLQDWLVWSRSPKDSQESSPNDISKASILWHSAFFMVQLSHLYVTTVKTTALTIWIFVGKVMSLLFNMLSRFVIAFLPRSKYLLILWLQSSSAVTWEPKKIDPVTVSIFSMSLCNEEMGPEFIILIFWMLSFKPSSFTLLFRPHQEAL